MPPLYDQTTQIFGQNNLAFAQRIGKLNPVKFRLFILFRRHLKQCTSHHRKYEYYDQQKSIGTSHKFTDCCQRRRKYHRNQPVDQILLNTESLI